MAVWDLNSNLDVFSMLPHAGYCFQKLFGPQLSNSKNLTSHFYISNNVLQFFLRKLLKRKTRGSGEPVSLT
jgi:hypothetical protein